MNPILSDQSYDSYVGNHTFLKVHTLRHYIEVLTVLFAECGLTRRGAELALCTLRCLVRGFVVHEVMSSFLATYSYAEAFEGAIEIFITGLSAMSAGVVAARSRRN